MAVGAQNDLGGQQTFARKMTWCIAFLCQNWDGYFCPNWGVLQKKKKKRSFPKFERFFCPNEGVLQKKKKKKKVLPEIWTVFLSKWRSSPKKKKKKGLHRIWDGILAMVCPNIQTICPNKQTICPNFRRFSTFWTEWGGDRPPCPPASYGYEVDNSRHNGRRDFTKGITF